MQAAKTYLERKFEEFPSCDVDALLQHGLKVSNPCLIYGISDQCLGTQYHKFAGRNLLKVCIHDLKMTMAADNSHAWERAVQAQIVAVLVLWDYCAASHIYWQGICQQKVASDSLTVAIS